MNGYRNTIVVFLIALAAHPILAQPTLCDSTGSLIPSCNGDRYPGTIFLQNVVVSTSNMNSPRYITAKGGDVVVGRNVSACTSVGDFVVSGGASPGDVDMRATGKIKFEHGFHAEAGCYLHAYINPYWGKVVLDDECDNADTTKKYWAKSNGREQLGQHDDIYDTATNVKLDGNGHMLLITTGTNFPIQRTPTTWDTIYVLASGVFSQRSSELRRASHNTGDNWFHGEIDSSHTGFVHRYGRYEARLRLPTLHDNDWPAFWLTAGSLFPTDSAHPNGYEEFDITEPAEGDCNNHVGPNYHPWGRTSISASAPQDDGSIHDFNTPYDLRSNYHTYAFEWEPGAFRWLVDDYVILRLPRVGKPNYPKNVALDGSGRPEEVYILLGNSFSNNVKHMYYTPDTLFVDYVRVLDIDTTMSFSRLAVEQSAYSYADDAVRSEGLKREMISISPDPLSGNLVSIHFSSALDMRDVTRITIGVYDQIGRHIASLGDIYGADIPQILHRNIPEQIPSGTYFVCFTLYRPDVVQRVPVMMRIDR